MHTLSADGQGHFAMLAFSLLVSLSFFFGHFIAPDIDPGALMALRFALATVFLLAVLKALGVPVVLARFWRFALIGGCMAAYFITMFEALRLTTAVSTAAVFTLTPLLAVCFGWVLLNQRTGPWVVAALLIGGAGAVWVIFRADLEALLRLEIGPGEAIFFFGTLAHGAVPALVRRLCVDVTPLQSSFATTLGALTVTCVYAFPALIETNLSSLPQRVWWVMAYLAIVTTAGTFFLLQYASKRLPGSKVMAYTYLVPSWVIFWEVVALSRWPAPAIFAGILATIVALLMLLRGEARV
ncbi:MAG: DMT family transporter [Boseongicola sp.]|nr:DMT family transporter [Silicimonas sp.]NNF90689.1 DMT family transporter [Boseongicola sp.]NNL34746.1 DMT family transporter [Silicimonas sp.]